MEKIDFFHSSGKVDNGYCIVPSLEPDSERCHALSIPRYLNVLRKFFQMFSVCPPTDVFSGQQILSNYGVWRYNFLWWAFKLYSSTAIVTTNFYKHAFSAADTTNTLGCFFFFLSVCFLLWASEHSFSKVLCWYTWWLFTDSFYAYKCNCIVSSELSFRKKSAKLEEEGRNTQKLKDGGGVLMEFQNGLI